MLRIIVTVVLVLILRSTTLAADPGATTGAADVLGQLVEIIGAALGALLLLLVKKGITYVEAKTKIDIPAKTEEMIYDWAARGTAYAEEKAYQASQKAGEGMKGPEKLEAAVNFALALAKEHGLDQLAKDKLVKYIEAHLGTTRSNP